MTYKVRLTREAHKDLDRLYDFLLKHDLGAAERALVAIERALNLLAFSPFSCRKALLQRHPPLARAIDPLWALGIRRAFRNRRRSHCDGDSLSASTRRGLPLMRAMSRGRIGRPTATVLHLGIQHRGSRRGGWRARTLTVDPAQLTLAEGGFNHVATYASDPAAACNLGRRSLGSATAALSAARGCGSEVVLRNPVGNLRYQQYSASTSPTRTGPRA